KSKIATAFVGQLQAIPPGKEDDRWWYRYRLIEGLGYVDRLDDVGGKPIVIDSLVHVLSDVNEVWINRSQAALSISRLPYTGAVNVQLIAYEIGRLLSQMTNAYNTSPKASIWKHTYSRVYLSFRPANAKEAAKRWGLLEQVKRPGVTQNENAVLELWDASFPMFQAVLTGSAGAIPDSDVNGLKTWMTDNTPSNRSVVPGAQPLPAPGQGAAPAQTTNPPAGGGASGTNDNAATNTPPTGG
ncbi:MAG: hypothetical protein KDA80_14920, partial [Planctomycetaceae bacterium]|nr:hypothetical protein [Planctomycetaceae bacterium]